MNLVFQGSIDTTVGTKIECSYDSMIISLIIINNKDINYILDVYRNDIAAENNQLLYRFDLTAGDSVRDTTQYKMAKGDILTLTVSQSNPALPTTYYISAEVS
jgi:methionine salvage enolase-phosphatase E1